MSGPTSWGPPRAEAGSPLGQGTARCCGPEAAPPLPPQFSQQEEKRQKSERLQQLYKHENQMRDMLAQCEGNMSELQQLQVGRPFPCRMARLWLREADGAGGLARAWP